MNFFCCEHQMLLFVFAWYPSYFRLFLNRRKITYLCWKWNQFYFNLLYMHSRPGMCQASRVCSPKSCGICGGSGCGNYAGGLKNCFVQQIALSERTCLKFHPLSVIGALSKGLNPKEHPFLSRDCCTPIGRLWVGSNRSLCGDGAENYLKSILINRGK